MVILSILSPIHTYHFYCQVKFAALWFPLLRFLDADADAAQNHNSLSFCATNWEKSCFKDETWMRPESDTDTLSPCPTALVECKPHAQFLGMLAHRSLDGSGCHIGELAAFAWIVVVGIFTTVRCSIPRRSIPYPSRPSNPLIALPCYIHP